MKGVVLSICPSARLVDLTHEIPPQDVLAGGLALEAAVPFFPAGTVHLAVVDPGVGTARRAHRHPRGRVLSRRAGQRPVHLRARGRRLDGGVTRPRRSTGWPRSAGPFTAATSSRPPPPTWPRASRSSASARRSPTRSASAAPAAAWRTASWWARCSTPTASATCSPRSRPRGSSERPGVGGVALEVAGRRLRGPVDAYAEGAMGEPAVIVGSTGRLEIFVKAGSARDLLGARPRHDRSRDASRVKRRLRSRRPACPRPAFWSRGWLRGPRLASCWRKRSCRRRPC